LLVGIRNNMDISIHHPSKEMPAEVAMSLNRHERRRLGKLNNLKIPGSNREDLKLKVIAVMKKKRMPEFLITFYNTNNRMPTEVEYKELQDA